ncbi:MAG: hypothetical protein M3O70_07245, partial [Actinomycetota bacterium]|nr:hypothetical protein [Actinomycetota bacterium]
LDATAIADAVRPTYASMDAREALHVDIAEGGHALTPARQHAIVDWTVAAANRGPHSRPEPGADCWL